MEFRKYQHIERFGTDEVDHFYPDCVMNWYPENLACNVGR